MKRYEALASEIATSIQTGVLRCGDRLPSVRQASASRGVSPSTVFEAYYLLEAKGLVRARERSGYYVAPGVRQFPPEPDMVSKPPDEAVALNVSELVSYSAACSTVSIL
ncbi:GntR family transcriptional regulator [Polaromonas hydrogenivorans]